MTDQANAVKTLGDTIKAEMSKKPPKWPLRRHHDDDYYDDVLIEASGLQLRAFIVPRYKTSGLSGDEWRISAKLVVTHLGKEVLSTGFHRMRGLVEHASHFLWKECRPLLEHTEALLRVYRKGNLLMREDFWTFGEAAMGMGWHIVTANEGRKGVKWQHLGDAEERLHCQQVGCSETPVNVYRLKKLQIAPSESDMREPKYDFEGQYTWYCARHTKRGDCGLEDADANLELVQGHGVAVAHEGDESPAAFGGVVHVKLP